MSDLSDLSDLSDICAAKISRAGKKARSQYQWVKYRGAPQYRQGMTALEPPGLAYLTGYAPMQYDRCGMTAAWGRRRIRCEVAKLRLAVKM